MNQCKGITKKNIQCTKNKSAKFNNDFCYLHQKQQTKVKTEIKENTENKSFFYTATNEQWDQWYENKTLRCRNTKDLEKFTDLQNYLDDLNHSDNNHITKETLKTVLDWKLTRGKYRPLMHYIEKLTEQEIIDASTTSFSWLQTGKKDLKTVVKAMNCLTKALKGVGTATASAVLTHCFHSIPFMSDQGLGQTLGYVDYKLSTYKKYYQLIKSKTQQLNEHSKFKWTCYKVEQILYLTV